MRGALILTVIMLIIRIDLTQAQNDGYWANASGGSWANAANWLDGAIANGTDSTANFGFSLEPINTNAIFTLDGPQTIGNLNFISKTNPAVWTFNPGTGGPLTLDATYDLPGVTVSPAGLQLNMNTALAGTNGLEKLGGGTLALAGANSYAGGTTVSAGALLVNGSLADTGTVTVAAGTLGGTGVISGPVVVQSGSAFSPGGLDGSLSLSNSLTLEPGSKTWINVNASTLAHVTVSGMTGVIYGGTLTVTNLAGSPALGQSFAIFSAVTAAGSFSTITPQLTGAVRWRFDPASGALSVVGTNLQPGFTRLALISTSLVFAASNGVPEGTNYVLAATNLTTPPGNWSRVATNVFDPGGNLVFTNTITPGTPRQFYRLAPQ